MNLSRTASHFQRGIPQFGRGNGKLPDSTLTFALPSGHTCPGALQCLALADRETGKISDGPQQTFRCYEASIENFRSSVRASRWRNFDILRGLNPNEATDLLLAGIGAVLDHKSTHVRWFTGGDLYSVVLRDAIFQACRETKELTHYFYTKNLPLLAPSYERVIDLPDNLRVVASWGGKFDYLAPLFPRTARVLHTRAEAERMGLPIDTTDRLAWQDEPVHFCHLSHGMQPAGSAAAQAIASRRRSGDFTGYGSKRKRQLAA
jgi:hypothetical protein